MAVDGTRPPKVLFKTIALKWERRLGSACLLVACLSPCAPPRRRILLPITSEQVAAAHVRSSTRPDASVMTITRLPCHCLAEWILFTKADARRRIKRDNAGAVRGAIRRWPSPIPSVAGCTIADRLWTRAKFWPLWVRRARRWRCAPRIREGLRSNALIQPHVRRDGHVGITTQACEISLRIHSTGGYHRKRLHPVPNHCWCETESPRTLVQNLN